MKTKVITILIGIVCLVIVIALGVKSYSAYTLRETKNKCIKKVETKVNFNLYRKSEQERIAKLKKEAEDKIKKEKNKDRLESYVDEYSESLKAIKTDKELAAIEKKEKKKKEVAREKAEAKKKAKEKKEKEQQTTKYINKKTYNTNSNSGALNNSGGCVGNDAKNFY